MVPEAAQEEDPADSQGGREEVTEAAEVDLLAVASVARHHVEDPAEDSEEEVAPEVVRLVEAPEEVLVAADADH